MSREPNGESRTAPKSLHFSPWDYTLSGANRSMLTLAAELASRSLAAVFCLHDGEVAAEARRLGIPVFTAYASGRTPSTRAGRICHVLRTFAAACRAQSAEVLHCHSAAGMRHAVPLAKACRLALVCHQRDNYRNDAFHRHLNWADRIIAISQWVYSTLPPRLQRKSTVIHNAILAPPGREAVPPISVIGTPIRIGVAARCIPEKGIDLFLDAATALVDEPVTFVIWGVDTDPWPGTHAWEIRRRIENGPAAWQHRISVAPFRPDMEEFFRSVDVVVVPSRFPEPFGRMAIEAMGNGRAVIAAEHGGLTEIIKDDVNGKLFRAGDAAALAAEIRQLVRNPAELLALAERGREDAINRFSSRAHGDAILEVYCELCRKPRRSWLWPTLASPSFDRRS